VSRCHFLLMVAALLLWTPSLRAGDQDAGDDGGETDEGEQDQPDHRGFFARVTPGVGWSWIRARGVMDPLPGLLRNEDPGHNTVALGVAGDLGGGIIRNLALHGGVLFEKMILRDRYPNLMTFNLFGFGLGLTYYFTPAELYLTGHIRFVAMLSSFPDVVCDRYWIDTFEWYRGPGFTLQFGKEWFHDADDESAAGLGLQVNYNRLYGDDVIFNYVSVLLVVTVTKF